MSSTNVEHFYAPSFPAGDVEVILRAGASELLGANTGLPIEFSRYSPARNRINRMRDFIVASSGGRPRLIAKRRLDYADTKVLREADILLSLAKSPWHPSVKVMATAANGFVMPYVLEVDLPSVWPLLTKHRRDAVLEAVVDEMAIFHESMKDFGVTSSYCVPDVRGATRLPPPILEKLLTKAYFGPTHGDLGPWNVRCDQAAKTIAFIDWEDYQPSGMPSFDLLNFLLTMSIVEYSDFRSRGFEWLYRVVFLERTSASDMLRRGVLRYAAARQLRPDLVLAHVPLFCWSMISRFEREERPTDNLYYRYFADSFEMSHAAKVLEDW
jgi:hypothetical protein